MPNPAEQQHRRHTAILEIVRQEPVSRQRDLVRLLRERGYEATQSSVSRDLRELGIVKLARGYGRPEGVHEAGDDGFAAIAPFVRTVQRAGPHLAVITTAAGAAQRVALSIDRAGWSEVVGTVSGDDTIFVATADRRGQGRLLARLAGIFRIEVAAQ